MQVNIFEEPVLTHGYYSGIDLPSFMDHEDRVRWVAALNIRGKDPSVLEKSAELSSHTGCDGYAISHYGGASFENLKAVRRGLQKSKWDENF